jgi:pimeloyl-ACP methyl ester carboxylesterase
MEAEAIGRAADEAGFERFHLYGHSAGGAISIAFATGNPERVLSLALDEPAFDFTEEEKSSRPWRGLDALAALPPEERTRAFLRHQMRKGVEPPPPPPGPPPPWMALRPAGIEAFMAAARSHLIPDEAFERFRAPVYYSHGSLSSEEWLGRRDRLARRFPDFTDELYEGCSHLNTSHQAEPARVAAALRKLWERAGASRQV